MASGTAALGDFNLIPYPPGFVIQFPEKENPNGQPTNISVLNIAYYPQERGPYNFDYERIDSEGRLLALSLGERAIIQL